MPPPPSCPDDSALRKFLQDELDTGDAERLDEHIGGCPTCQTALDRMLGSMPREWFPDLDAVREDAAGTNVGTTSVGQIPRALATALELGDGTEPGSQPRSPEPPSARKRPARLHLLGEIARGGMGAVFRGRDVALGRDLAVKVLLEEHRNKPELVQRFVMEARIAGQLQHPGTVPVHEIGELADGRPYFAMKLVKGRTLEALLSERKDPTEDLPRFLAIFEHVCQTVAYAHARGAIHRDLKPANIMVGRFGEVQVMDWGLAKVLAGTGASQADGEPGDGTFVHARQELDDQTEFGRVLGTWAYMPPEQARGRVAEIDRRSDVFGLGAILAKILTGKPPYVGPDSASVRIQAMEGQLNEASARLDGCGADAELVQLAERCLAPDPADRPADGGEVASAVAAYLSSVQEDLHQERLARERQEVRAALGRRHQRVLALATMSILLALSLGVVASTIFALRERTARQKATQQALMAEESLFILGDVLAQADPARESNREITLREALDHTTEKLNSGDLKNRIKTPESNAGVRIILGKIYFNLGEYSRSRDLFAEAYRIARDEFGETDLTALTALDQLGKAHIFLEEFADAERTLKKVYELRRRVLGPEHEETIHSYAKLADLYADMGKLDLAQKMCEEVLKLRRKLWGNEYEFTLVSMNQLGLLYRDLGRKEEALKLFEEAERIARRTQSENSPAALSYKHNLALACADLDRIEEAVSHFSECLDRRVKILGRRHLSTLKTEYGIASLFRRLGHYDRSRSRSESILERLAMGTPEDHSFRGNVLLNLGRCLTALGEYSKAEQTLREAQEIFLKKMGPQHRFSRSAERALEELQDRKLSDQDREDSPSDVPIPSADHDTGSSGIRAPSSSG
jgi:tetratricopeptide (TPR) repeat protein